MFCRHCGKEIPSASSFCPFCGNKVSEQSLNNQTEPVQQAVPQPKYEPATTGVRFLNYFIDGIVRVLCMVVVGMIVYFINRSLVTLVELLVGIAYYLVFEGIWQRTPAKWMTKTKVVMQDGSKPDFLHILGRSFARIIPFEAFSFLGGPIGWHDSLSKTLVVPSHYTPEQVLLINKNAKTKTSTVAIVVICLFVGIMILGLLASIVLLSLNSAREKSRDAKRLADVRQMGSALELYYNDKNMYPASLADLTNPQYIGILPVAPTPADGNCSAENNSYHYVLYSKDSYGLSFCLGQSAGGYSAGMHSLTKDGIEDGGLTEMPNSPLNGNQTNTNNATEADPTIEAAPGSTPTQSQACPGIPNSTLGPNNSCSCNTGYLYDPKLNSCVKP